MLLANLAAGQQPPIDGVDPIESIVNVTQSSELGRGVNFGNMLEAPYEGAWGLTVEPIFFNKTVAAGMQHIRLPISWTHHALQAAPYTIEDEFFQRVDWAISEAVLRGLKIIVNVHHYDELHEDPVAERPRALAIWEQIADRYKDFPDNILYFEALNEPHGAFNESPQLWNDYLDAAINVIRVSNPNRPILVGPAGWNSISELESFDPPEDPNLIATIHYYDPFEFTHQGATWIDPAPRTGVRWVGNEYKMVNGWQDYSWGTDVEKTKQGLTITATQGYSGYYFHSEQGVANATHLVFSADKAMNLRIKATGPDGVGPEIAYATTDGNKTYQIPMTQLGSPSFITDVWLMNDSPNAVPKWRNRKFLLKTTNGKHVMVGTQQADIEIAMNQAVEWANDRGMALYLGEFGAFELANFSDRVRWTSAVRQVAERRNIDWGYWELAAGFGFYDPNSNTFRRQLLKALNPDFSR